MHAMGCIHDRRKDRDQAVKWYTKGAAAGLPGAMYDLACALEEGGGLAPPDYRAAASWYRRAADAGVGNAANNLTVMYQVGRGKGLTDDACHT